MSSPGWGLINIGMFTEKNLINSVIHLLIYLSNMAMIGHVSYDLSYYIHDLSSIIYESMMFLCGQWIYIIMMIIRIII
jgi:hypothetical protein